MKNLNTEKTIEDYSPLDVQYFNNYELAGIHPEYCDVYIDRATAVLNNGAVREATDEELDLLNENQDLIYDLLQDYLY